MYKKLIPEIEEVIDNENIVLLFEEKTIILNSTGWFIWKNIENVVTIEELATLFKEENNIIDVELQEIKDDFFEYIENMKATGLIYE